MTTLRTVAALYVDKRGCYADAPGVELWDVKRDARGYEGPHPVVAHPPCSRWCQLAGLVQARWGHKIGDDDGCFAAALGAVRKFGGVLEHPAYTKAWPAFGLPVPPYEGWQRTLCGGWVCCVDQHKYGHLARKRTWLYACVANPPTMEWGRVTEKAAARVSFCQNHGPRVCDQLSKRQAKATPPAFRDALLAIARSVPL